MGKNHSIIDGTRKIISTVLTQAVILGLSIITGFLLPQKMGPEKYGYFQVYIFYMSYINIVGLGFNDGLNLFYAGFDYEKLPFDRLRSAIRFFCTYLTIITVFTFISLSIIPNSQYRQIFQMLAINIPLICLQCVLLSLFLSVNRTGIYNIVNLLTKVLSTVLILTLVAFSFMSPINMMVADTLIRVPPLILCIFLGRRLFIGNGIGKRSGAKEFYEKSKPGMNITLAIIASTFIPVAGRVIIEWNESKEIYGMYSFAMTLLMIIITFTSTAGTVVFPLMKRLSAEKLPVYFPSISLLCDTLIYIALLGYIPLAMIIKTLMVQYVPVLSYLHILMAMCLPLGRMQLLITPYYKAMRMERAFLLTNAIGVATMLTGTAIAYGVFRSVIAVAICSTIVLALWTLFTDLYLCRKLNYNFSIKSLLTEVMMTAAFVIAGCFGNIYLFVSIYGCVLILYIVVSRLQIKDLFMRLSKSRSQTE